MSAKRPHANRGGETPGARETIARTAKQWADNGMDPGKAKAKARECAVRVDRGAVNHKE